VPITSVRSVSTSLRLRAMSGIPPHYDAPDRADERLRQSDTRDFPEVDFHRPRSAR